MEGDINDVISGSDVGGGDHLELVVEQGLGVILVEGNTEAKGVLHDDVGVHLTKLDLEVSEVQVDLKVLVSAKLLLEQGKVRTQAGGIEVKRVTGSPEFVDQISGKSDLTNS